MSGNSQNIEATDLISRAALLADIKMGRNQLVLGKCAAEKLAQYVNAAPAVEAEPVRHGRWIHDGIQISGGIDWCHCSECGQKEDWDFPTNYCHKCGAKMDG